MNDERFTAEESTALLHYIWPEWPGQRNRRPIPDVRQWLEDYRDQQKQRTQAQSA